MTFRILIVAVIAAIFSLKGFHTGSILASAGILTMPKPTKFRKQLIVKARRVSKRRPEQLSDIDLDYLSVLVDGVDPANGAPVIVKSTDGSGQVELQMHLVQKDVAQGLLYATNYEPDKIDKQNQTATAQEIQKMAHALMKKGVNIDVNHNLKKSDSYLVESFILRGEDPMFPNISKGSHCVVIQLSDDLKAKAESITGISMYGHAVVQKDDPAAGANNDPDPVDPDGDGKALQGLRASAGVGDVQMAQALGLEHQAYLDFENGAADYEWTADSIKAAAKLLKMPVEEFTSSLLNGSLGDEPAETDPPSTDPAQPAPAGPAAKSVTKNQPTKTMPIPESRRILKATEPSLIKVNGNGAQIISVEKSQADRFSIIGKAFLYGMKRELLREGALPESYFETPEQLIAKGLFTPGDFDPSGSIQPALAREVFDVTVDRSGFLKKIQTTMMSSIKQNVAVADVGERTMVRITVAGSPGATVASGAQAKTVNLAKQLEAHELDLPFFVPFSLVYNYQGNLPALEQKIGEIIMLSNANQFVDLGLNGTSDTYVGTFLTLSQGWLALGRTAIAAATDGANPAQSFSIAGVGGLTTQLKVMDYMIATMSQYQARYANISNAFVMGTADFETFEVERIARPNSEQVLTDGARYIYRGHEIVVVDYLTTGNLIYTPLQNFLFGMVTQGQGGTRLQSLEVIKGMQHNLSSAVDYDFVNYQPLVIAAA